MLKKVRLLLMLDSKLVYLGRRILRYFISYSILIIGSSTYFMGLSKLCLTNILIPLKLLLKTLLRTLITTSLLKNTRKTSSGMFNSRGSSTVP
jgi:hypothetical protein